MRTNKRATIATLLITLLTFVVCAILHKYNPKPFWYDISLACFGSALLGCVVAYSAYSAERRKAMESFWQEGLSLINTIRKIRYLKIDEPIDILEDCFTEEYGIHFQDEDNHDAKDKFMEWVEENIHPYEGEPDYSERMEEYYNGIMKHYTKDLRSILKSYVDFSKTRLQPLTNAYGSLDFIAANHSIRKNVYDNTYKKIRDFQSACQKESREFELAIEGDAHLPAAFNKALIINQLLYSETDGKIYAYLADELDQDLEQFRSKIYHVKPEDMKPIPLNNMINFDEPHQVFRQKREESILDDTSVLPFLPEEE